MRTLIVATVLCASAVLAGSGAAWPQGQGAQVPAAAPRVQASQAQNVKLQDPAITKLQDQVAQLVEQDRQATAQIGQLKTQLAQLQAQVAEFKQSAAGAYVPTAGPGNCGSRGYMNAASAMSSPTLLVYTWGNCKSK